ncbi:MAG TPA: PAS domain-containing protein [Methanoculleus sp.]|nr:PAS domain-containing protein [Methanoculleus sp.]
MTWPAYEAAVPLIIALFLNTGIALILAREGWRHRRALLARIFVVMMTGVVIWSLLYAIQLGIEGAALQFSLVPFQYIGIQLVILSAFFFAVKYTGNEPWLTGRAVVLITAVLAAILIAVFTNGLHHLYYTGMAMVETGPFPHLSLSYGPLFTVQIAYAYMLTITALLMMTRHYHRSNPRYRRQTVLLMLAYLIPLAGNMAGVAGIGSFRIPFDPTPFCFLISGIILFYIIVMHEFLAILPIAREHAVEALQEGYLVLDENRRVIDINKAALAIFDASGERILGAPARLLWKGFDNAGLREGSSEVTGDAIRKALSGRFYELSCTPVTGRVADQEGFIVFIHDITEKRRYRDKLSEANRKINLMADITRHDILNQVQGITMILELIRMEEPAAPESRLLHYLGLIERGAVNIEHQISFTRDYQDVGVDSPVWQNVGAVVAEAAGLLSSRNLTVTAETGAADYEVYGDPLLGKVFYNLFENAARHGGENISTVTVHAAPVEGGEGALLITIQDNGEGIPEGLKERIFDPSFGKNTGFGLFLTREILSITGIAIHETGTEGEGACFAVTVPPGAWRMAKAPPSPDSPPGEPAGS